MLTIGYRTHAISPPRISFIYDDTHLSAFIPGVIDDSCDIVGLFALVLLKPTNSHIVDVTTAMRRMLRTQRNNMS